MAAMSSPEKRVYEFGPFRLDPSEHVLLRDGEPVPLRPKEFAVLLALVGNHRHVLTKEELLEAVWPDQFIEEGNLNRQISTLRRVLGDTSDEPQYVQTVPKVGYRFVASVREIVERSADMVERELREQSSDLVIERRTLSRIVTEEEDETDVRELEPGFEPVALLTTGKKDKRIARIQWLVLAIAGVLVISLTLALTYSRNLRRSHETNAAPVLRSLAVLPFKPIGVGDEDEYLGLGMADALITKLSNMRQLNIRPTSAVRKYGARDLDPMAAARELGVEAVLEGSVQRLGEEVRVTVQLVSVKDGAPLWAAKFDEPFTNIFTVQDRISEQVARALTLTLSSEEKQLLTKRYTENSEAYQLYLKGRYFWNKRTVEGLKKGINYFNQAVEKDPSYALAYVGLADSYSLLSDYGGLPPKEAYPQAKKAAMQALELDDQLAEAHATLAYIKTGYDWDWPGAEIEYRRAIELNPNYETAHQWYGEYLSGMGRHQEAITEIRRAREINPASLIINAVEVSILCIAREYDQGIAQGQKALEMDPHFAEVYEYLKRCYDGKGMYKEAIAARQMRRKLAGVAPEETAAMRDAAAATSARVYWQKRLKQEAEESKQGLSIGFEMAEIFAQLGEKDQAFAWLERAYEQRSFMMLYLKVAPNLDPLRSDPRFADLLRRVGHTP
jgi:DNA-binding winged helix-turn-helix (wHTH) protein/TolB-like protein/Tfp pilus assembly protein PilF